MIRCIKRKDIAINGELQWEISEYSNGRITIFEWDVRIEAIEIPKKILMNFMEKNKKELSNQK